MASGTFPIRRATTHKIVSHVLTRSSVLASGVVAMAVFQGARFAFPTVFAPAIEVRYSIDTCAVVSTRIGVTIVSIC